MKKFFLIVVLAVFAVACNNEAKKEAEEARKRDSIDNLKMDENQRFVDSLERADEAAKKAAEAHHDSASHEGHDHEGHDHAGHSH